MTAVASSLLFFGLTAIVFWVVWQAHKALPDRAWVRYLARGVGLAFSAFSGSVSVALLASSDSGSLATVAVAITLGAASVLLAVGSLGPSTAPMKAITGVG